MPGFTTQHIANFIDLIPVTWNQVPRGSLIKARYKSEEKGTIEKKLYLVLDPLNSMDHKMHVLDLDFISPKLLKQRLFKHTLQKEPLEEQLKNRTFTRLDFVKDPLDIYKIIIKRLINDGFGPSYRTIWPKNLSSVNVIHYEWYDKRKDDQQGITQEEHLSEENERKRSGGVKDRPEINDRKPSK